MARASTIPTTPSPSAKKDKKDKKGESTKKPKVSKMALSATWFAACSKENVDSGLFSYNQKRELSKKFSEQEVLVAFPTQPGASFQPQDLAQLDALVAQYFKGRFLAKEVGMELEGAFYLLPPGKIPVNPREVHLEERISIPFHWAHVSAHEVFPHPEREGKLASTWWILPLGSSPDIEGVEGLLDACGSFANYRELIQLREVSGKLTENWLLRLGFAKDKEWVDKYTVSGSEIDLPLVDLFGEIEPVKAIKICLLCNKSWLAGMTHAPKACNTLHKLEKMRAPLGWQPIKVEPEGLVRWIDLVPEVEVQPALKELKGEILTLKKEVVDLKAQINDLVKGKGKEKAKGKVEKPYSKRPRGVEDREEGPSRKKAKVVKAKAIKTESD
ncbi:hypothetical protein SCP_1104510 [Sparassis crispa]|uniref:Uncharacterized protein n=1 Tax=Sparassis crispa TaxID=139825 RepID=A0A401H047_9APHY|nr:hypothetical protein SCP_1104510 [Sparassis crispa]GBE87772.1 hypothetical protein SCP_1104510 [Sparassis crispa]